MQSKRIVAFAFACIIGQLAPLIFISLDLGELGLPWSFRNAFDIYQSQRIYFFSSIAFPAFLFFIFLLYLKIKNQRFFYQSILDGAQEMVLVLDQSHKAIYRNAAFDRSGLDHSIAKAFLGQTFPIAVEIQATINNRPRFLLCSGNHSQVRRDFTFLFRDITTIRENLEKIKFQEETVLRSSQLASLGEMASGIAHEINNPLGVIIGNVGILRDDLETPLPGVLKSLDTIDRMAIRISAIVKAMKNLSRKAELEVVEDVDLEFILTDIINLSMINFKNLGIDLQIEMGAFKDKIIKGSSVQISQAFLNLIGNASHAIEGLEEKWLRVTLEEEGDSYLITFQNSGPQMSREIQERIFQPFFTTKAPGKGTGLGLSVSRSIVEAHQGTLNIDPGSAHPTFVLSLPRP